MAQSGRSVGELADLIDKLCAGSLPATIRGDRTRHLVGTAPLASATQEQLSFLSNSRYRSAAAAATAGALVLSPADARAIFADDIGDRTLIETKNPYAWFALAAQQLAPAAVVVPGISASADIAPSARIDRTARIEAYAVVEADAVIGAGTWIGAGSYVGRACHVGERTRLYPGVRLMEATVVGARAVIHSGAVLGADGFGFAPHEGRWLKIPQTGRVIVGDDVEIGANTTIDRGAMGDTVIEEGVKLDNQIQIGHNCRIGAHTVLAGCVGVAGSANIGRGCQIGGAAMIAGHLSIADGTIISGGTLVSRTIREAGFYTGIYPMMTNRDWERSAAVVRNLEDLRLRLRALEKQLKGEGGDPS